MKNTILNLEQLGQYFSRLGLPAPKTRPECNYDLLCQLQYAHVTKIPYENLDIVAGNPLPMTVEGQYDKMAARHRGGYCFELNGLLAALLAACGCKVTTYMGRFLRGETEIPMRRHRVVRAECKDGTIISDVGIGQSAPRHPLRLKEGLVQEQFGESYKIQREPFLGWVIYDLHKGQWRRFYSFTEEEQLDIDFVMPSFYCEKSPDSIFNKALMVAIKTRDGRKTIDGNKFRIFRPGDVNETVIESSSQLAGILADHFYVSSPDPDEYDLWYEKGCTQ